MTNLFRAVAAVAVALLAGPAAAQERVDVGPFHLFTAEPDRLYLDGALDANVDELLATNSELLSRTTTLFLNSAEGTLISALVVAEMVRAELINTTIAAGATCVGPCFFVFMAGI